MDTRPYKHPALISKPGEKQQLSRISSWWLLQLQITHHTVWIQCAVLRRAGMGWGCAVRAWLPSPPLLLLQGQQWGRGWNALGWCDGHEGSEPATGASLPRKKTCQPLAPAGGNAFPMLAQQHLQEPSHYQTGICSVESWAVSCGLGQKLRGLVWGEGWSDRGMEQAAQSSLYSRHKTKKLNGSSELRHLF